MRARVESTWRTQLLLFLAFVAAGAIAWNRVQSRLAEERRTEAAEPTEAPATDERGNVVDVEIVDVEIVE